MNIPAFGKALVSGANGYVGSALTRHLVRRGVEVHALTRKHHNRLESVLDSARIHSIDANSTAIEALVRAVQPDAIFHLASVQKDPTSPAALDEMFTCNLTLGTALLRGAAVCDRLPVFVNTGSFWQFDQLGNFAPNTLYAASKQAFLNLLAYYRRCEGIAALTLVLYDTFGLDDPRPKIWGRVLNASDGERIPLTEGRHLIELVHIDDIVRAYEMAAALLISGKAAEALYCVRSGRHITLRALLESFKAQAAKDVVLAWGEVPYRSGQVFNPWQGPLLPDWRAEVLIEAEIAEYGQQIAIRRESAREALA